MSETMTLPTAGLGPIYRGVELWLPLLLRETAIAGKPVIEGKTFIDCRIHGPAVLIPVSGCDFNACNLGDSHGDMRNLLFKPLGLSKIVGGIPMKDCRFERCDFIGIGYSGSPEFLAQMEAIPGLTA